MKEICAGVRRWDPADPPDDAVAYIMIWCTEGRYAVNFPETSAVVLPGRCMIVRYSRGVSMPIGLTGRESGMILLMDTQRMQCHENRIRFLSTLPECAVFADPRGDAVLEVLMQETCGEELSALKIEELLLISEQIQLTAPHTCRCEELRTALDAYRFAMEHIQERITIQTMAQWSGRSPAMLKFCFWHVFGAPVYTFLRREKMHRAAGMLAGSDVKIIEIAQKTGYENSSKFSKAFADVIGMTPSAYRKAHRICPECRNGTAQSPSLRD